MKKLVSTVLIMMILCSLFTGSALAENAQGQAATDAQTATMSVTGGTINPDGTVSWAVGENILTITMPDGSVYTITVIYEPEAEEAEKPAETAAPAEEKTEETATPAEEKTEEAAAPAEEKTEEAAELLEPVVLSALTVSGTALPVEGDSAAAATPNESDTIAVVTEPADASVTVNGETAENGETSVTWAEGSNVVTVELAKEGYATTTFTLNVEYTPAEDAAPAENAEEDGEAPENAAPAEEATPAEEAAPAENTEENGEAPEEAAPAEEATPAGEATETDALAALAIDATEIDLDKFVKGSSDEKQNSYSFDAAAAGEYDLTASSNIVKVTAAEGWTVSSVKLNAANQVAAGTDSYQVKWAKNNDLEITLKKNDSEFKTVYNLILFNTLDEITVDALTVNGVDATALTALQAAEDNSYSLQVVAGEGKTAAVSVNGVPAALDASGMLVVPAVTGAADSVAVTVSKEGCLDKTYAFTVSAAPVALDQAQPAADDVVNAEASENADAVAPTEPAADASVNTEAEPAGENTAPEAVL